MSSTGGDEVEYRFLHRDPTRPPTSNPHLALRGEPEMISAEYEQGLADAARLRDRQRRLAAYRSMRESVFGTLDEFVRAVGPQGGVGSSVRAARRSIDQLARRV